ncbi:MAG: acylneuraminate cytidylyltransferase, partial [bacterium]|nr:acylneuraminate cytidylyltransferase [bacterium]
MKKIAAIIQARMTSQRFPGKVLYQVQEKPLLQYILESLAHCPHLHMVIVATSTGASDNPIAEFCIANGIECARGPLEDVAGRFKETLEKYDLNAFIRISGDSPLISPALINEGMRIFNTHRYEIVTNIQNRTFPKGQSLEILAADSFQRAYPVMESARDREHVTPY